MILVFLVSAIGHELVVGVPLHMLRGWAFWGIMLQVRGGLGHGAPARAGATAPGIQSLRHPALIPLWKRYMVGLSPGLQRVHKWLHHLVAGLYLGMCLCAASEHVWAMSVNTRHHPGRQCSRSAGPTACNPVFSPR